MVILDISKHNRSEYVTVRFNDEFGCIKTIPRSAFENGSVLNPYNKSVYGTGYLGEGKYKSKNENKLTPQYYTWRGMIRRCYYEKRRYVEPAYWDCEVCDEWLNFKTFAEWYDENFYDVGEGRMHLDKDILIKNNRLYSSNICIFVPQKINMIFTHPSKKDGLPTGITKANKSTFTARYNGKWLGNFQDIDSAVQSYNMAKKKHIIELANQYKDRMPAKIYNILLQY